MEIKLDKKVDKILENLLSNSKNSIEYKLGLKISESILLLENEKNYLLDIKSIKANKNLYEIRIKSPLNYRIFYYDNNGKEIHRQARIIDFSELDYRIKQTL